MNQLATNQNRGLSFLKNQLTSDTFKSKLKELHNNVPPEKFLSMVMTVIHDVPKLQQCSPASLMLAITTAYRFKLQVGGPMPECYLIPYGKTAKFMLGYRGMVTLMVRDEIASDFWANVVYPDDLIKVTLGQHPKLVHEPNLFSDNRSDEQIVGAYACAKLPNGDVKFDFMTRAEIEKVRAVSQAKDKKDSPWNTWYAQMCEKSVIRRLFKSLPTPDMSETSAAVAYEERTQHDETDFEIEFPDESDAVLAELGEESESIDESTGEVIEPTKKKKTSRKKATNKAPKVEDDDDTPAPAADFSMQEQIIVAFREQMEAQTEKAWPDEWPVDLGIAKCGTRCKPAIEWPTEDPEDLRRLLASMKKVNMNLVRAAALADVKKAEKEEEEERFVDEE